MGESLGGVARIRSWAGSFAAPLRATAVRRLWAAQLISEVGDWAARLALAVLVLQRTRSAAAVGLVIAASMIGWFGPGQLLTGWTERWPRRRVMITADLIRAAAFAVAALPLPLPALVALVTAAGCVTPPCEATRAALRPVLVPPGMLGAATATMQLSGDAAMLAGYLLGGTVVAAVGAPLALLGNSASFLISVYLSARLPTVRPAKDLQQGRLRAATRLLAGTPLLRRAGMLVLATQGAAAGLDALLAPYALQVVHAGPGRVAILALLTATASLALTAVVPHSGSAAQLIRRTEWLTVLPAAATAALFAFAPAAGGFAAYCVAGSLLVSIVPANVLLAPRLPETLRASAFSLLAGATVAVQGGGAAIAGVLATVVSIPTAAALLPLPALAVGALAVLRPLPGRALSEPLAGGPAVAPDVAPPPGPVASSSR